MPGVASFADARCRCMFARGAAIAIMVKTNGRRERCPNAEITTKGAIVPIRPENRARYPKDWNRISREIREAAGQRCEGSPAYPDCRAENGKPHPVTGSKVVLTVAHLDHVPENCERDNLRAWCQRCHNTYDAPERQYRRRQRESGMANMFEIQQAK